MPRTHPRSNRFGAERTTIRVAVGDRPVLALAGAPGRVRVGLAMPPLDRVVDVSVQPVTACRALEDAARRARVAPEDAEAAARQALLVAQERFASWAPDDEAGLLAGFGGAAFPLLAAAYAEGAAPVTEVPRWAEPVVSAASARAGALVAFGHRTTRPVVRALATAIAAPAVARAGDEPRPVDFTGLALGLIGRRVLEPDRLARVLEAPRLAHPAADLPDPATLAHAERTVAAWGPHRAERVLLDAAATDGGLRLLLDTVRYAQILRGHGPPTLPNRLAELHDIHRARVATAPPPPRPAPAPVPRPRRAPDPLPPAPPAAPEPRRAAAHGLYAPPADLNPVTGTTRLPASPAALALDGRCVDGVTFRVPRTAGDLERWGRLLSNCLGGFGAAVVAGRSTIIGIEVDGTLRFAVEIVVGRRIRQFAGQANRAPSARVRRIAVRTLVEVGLVDPNAT